jgi:uncharacterized protein with von Willebrand factor type A (vWA) domain
LTRDNSVTFFAFADRIVEHTQLLSNEMDDTALAR